MDFRPVSVEERKKLLEALRGNAESNQTILMDRRNTSFTGVSDEIPDEEVISAVRAVPCHYSIELLPWQERVVNEKAELDEKLDKLATFQGSELFAKLPVDARVLLDRQYSAMANYSEILGERIAAFPA